MKILFSLVLIAYTGCANAQVTKDAIIDDTPAIEETQPERLKVGDRVVYVLTVKEKGKIVAFFKPDMFFLGAIVEKVKDEFRVKWENGEESILPPENLGRYRAKEVDTEK